jgi:orotidine-5'-phosphate decarboxylase
MSNGSAGRTPQLVVALDVPTFVRASDLIAKLSPLGVMFKVGFESLYGYGEPIKDRLETAPGGYFVDAKLHDIPRTVAAAMHALIRPGVRIINVHALGGAEMMAAAVEAAEQRAHEFQMEAPLVFAVTILTSIGAEELPELGLEGGLGENVIRLAALARDARCAGVVCSPREVRDLKAFFGTEFLALTGGVRPAGAAHGDQKRVATPREAVEAGADYLVVGRPITESDDPVATASAILAEMRG